MELTVFRETSLWRRLPSVEYPWTGESVVAFRGKQADRIAAEDQFSLLRSGEHSPFSSLPGKPLSSRLLSRGNPSEPGMQKGFFPRDR